MMPPPARENGLAGRIGRVVRWLSLAAAFPYLILSSRDISAAISACKDINCVIFDAVTDGAVLQPADDGHNSFWLRVKTPALPSFRGGRGRRQSTSPDALRGSFSSLTRTPRMKPTSRSMQPC
jgi:hypothetical protein